ncbi:unnamed protein product [Rotaria sp. Silwood1]|nr:unnamed protein product [Rotaria sp. Silwood1]CAF1657042.1 unnamed protein product [Rotaria sp. Silwood1]CAF3845262.1 unnamed protein product [Rotaria sp. Silwood1]CAF4819791.1 unnamed protein product [Rotaria sp. Silwood1]CAF5075989.1 unnamed protein product [Rotaria sp. Silwood1]
MPFSKWIDLSPSNWSKEIQDIFEELKTNEQEIHDREQAILQLIIQHDHQHMRLEQWEHELKLLIMSTNNQECLY